MMNDEQLEKAAREFCRLEGIEPDSTSYGEWSQSAPAWQVHARLIRKQENILRAIYHAMEGEADEAPAAPKPPARKRKRSPEQP